MMFSGNERITLKVIQFNSICFCDPKYVYCKKKFLNISCSLDILFVHKKLRNACLQFCFLSFLWLGVSG